MKNPRIERRIIRMKEKFAFLSQNSKHNLLLFFSTAALIALYLTPPQYPGIWDCMCSYSYCLYRVCNKTHYSNIPT